MKCDRNIWIENGKVADAEATGRGQSRHAGNNRRRGTVLILVVALLGMLFVAGATLLSTVTFSTKTLEAEKEKRNDLAAVDGIERYLSDLLAKGFLGEDGHPYNAGTTGLNEPIQDSAPYKAAWPPYGEIPGVHLSFDFNEPVDYGEVAGVDQGSQIKFYSEFDRAADDLPRITRYDVIGSEATELGIVPLHNLNPNDPLLNESFIVNLKDADGDGIPDGPQIEIPSSMISEEAKRALAARLRDPDYIQPDVDEDEVPYPGPDTVYLTTRIIPHGAMVNINAKREHSSADDTLVANVLGFKPSEMIETNQPYLSDADEWALRNRGGVILPRSLDSTRLMEDLLATDEGTLAAPLLKPQAYDTSASARELLEDSSARRWWQFDADLLGDYDDSLWRQAMDAAWEYKYPRTYDIAHLLTTVSHDDQLIRGGKAEGTNEDLIEWMMDDSRRDDFAWDNYPDFLDDQNGTWQGERDPRLGRLKLSLPYLDSNGILAPEEDVDDLPGSTGRTRYIETIQDAFLLLLRNRSGEDFDLDGDVDSQDDEAIVFTAAALTANLIDFVDSNDESTAVPVRGFDGKVWGGNNLTAYGLERQPYITEVFAYPKKGHALFPDCLNKADAFFAVEIYNPYDTDLSLKDYWLKDLGSGSTEFQNAEGGAPASMPRMDFELPDDAIIAAKTHRVLAGFGTSVADSVNWTDEKFAFDKDSNIALVRKYGSIEVVVDQVNVGEELGNGWITDSGGTVLTSGDSAFGKPNMRASIQRDTTDDAWRFVVPRTVELHAADEETLNDALNHDESVNPDIRTVRIGISNTGKFYQALPTTGSLLLLMRHAHQTDDTGKAVAFNHVYGLMAKEYDQIDNGRMPVFDLAGNYRKAPSSVKGEIQGTEALPWGQLVFDYFTALPLREKANNDYLVSDMYNDMRPYVSEDGLKVTGRININAAPWSVISGLSYVPTDRATTVKMDDVLRNIFPNSTEIGDKLLNAILPDDRKAARRFHDRSEILVPSDPQTTSIGMELAEAIAAYRDARHFWTDDDTLSSGGGNDFSEERDPMYGDRETTPATFRQGYGFLTVGELLNVRDPDITNKNDHWRYAIDGGVVQANAAGSGNELIENDYIRAIGKMVALSDWVTTKSHVFTIYGTIRGQNKVDLDLSVSDDLEEYEESVAEVESRAIRFQVTVDRLPMLLGADRPVTIGTRVVEGYQDVRSD